VEPHDKFQRVGDDIIYEQPISFTMAALGGDVMVPTLHGKVKMNIKPGTQTHSILRLKGKGMPHLHGNSNGDQLIKIIVKTPVKLSGEQKELFRKLQQLEEGPDVKGPKGGKGIFEKMKGAFETGI
jgi:molecular chaperone DnaJ